MVKDSCRAPNENFQINFSHIYIVDFPKNMAPTFRLDD